MPAPKREADGIAQTFLDCGQARRPEPLAGRHGQQTKPGLLTPASPRNRPHSHLVPETSPRKRLGFRTPCGAGARAHLLPADGEVYSLDSPAPAFTPRHGIWPPWPPWVRPAGAPGQREDPREGHQGGLQEPPTWENRLSQRQKIHIPTEHRGRLCVGSRTPPPPRDRWSPAFTGWRQARRVNQSRLPQQARAGFPRERGRVHRNPLPTPGPGTPSHARGNFGCPTSPPPIHPWRHLEMTVPCYRGDSQHPTPHGLLDPSVFTPALPATLFRTPSQRLEQRQPFPDSSLLEREGTAAVP